MNVLYIAWREFRATFTTTLGWVVLCGWLLVTGIEWVGHITEYVRYSEDVFNPYGPQQVNLTDWILLPFYWFCGILLILVLPAVSMRLFAEETKQRSIELLLTAPVSTFEIVLGKFLGAMGFVCVLLLGTLQYPLGLAQWGSPDPGVVLGCYVALVLLASAVLSLGLFASALTHHQMIAAVVSLSASLALLFVSRFSEDPTDVFGQLSIAGHLEDLMRGAVRLSDVVYYLVFTGFFLFATHQRVETFRWR